MRQDYEKRERRIYLPSRALRAIATDWPDVAVLRCLMRYDLSVKVV